MNALGLLILLTGGFFISSALQNKSPLATLKGIITNPSGARTALTARGDDYTVTHSDSGSFGGGGSFDSGGSVQGGSLGGVNAFGAGAGSAAGAAAITYARAQIGKPYKWGATGPDAFDCSGLVYKAYQSAGVSLPRTTAGMVTRGKPVARQDLMPGDLVFPTVAHVGIYTGNGNFVEAPSTGKNVREGAIWSFWTARRIA